MPESYKHMKLVDIIVARTQELVPEPNWPLIAIDSHTSYNLPKKTSGGFKPDVLYISEGMLIIGEAKTSNDIETPHSKSQYLSYIKECDAFAGQAFLIIAVPWTEKISIANLIKRMIQQEDTKYFNLVILDDISRGPNEKNPSTTRT